MHAHKIQAANRIVTCGLDRDLYSIWVSASLLIELLRVVVVAIAKMYVGCSDFT